MGISTRCGLATDLTEDDVEGFKRFSLESEGPSLASGSAIGSSRLIPLLGGGLAAIIVIVLAATNGVFWPSASASSSQSAMSHAPFVNAAPIAIDPPTANIAAPVVAATLYAHVQTTPERHRHGVKNSDEPASQPAQSMTGDVDAHAHAQLETLRDLQSKM